MMTRLLGISSIWGRGYTTVPITVRKILGLEDGDNLEWYITEDGKIFVRRHTIEETGGSGSG